MNMAPQKAALGHAKFAHLRVKSPYSLLEGAVRPKELAGLCTRFVTGLDEAHRAFFHARFEEGRTQVEAGPDSFDSGWCSSGTK